MRVQWAFMSEVTIGVGPVSVEQVIAVARLGTRVVISSEGNVLTFNGKAPQTAEIATFDAAVPKRKMH